MHELSVAEAIAGVAERHARGRRVTAVEVSIGRLRQVVPASLEFSWDLVTRETVLEGSRLEIVDVPAAGRCRACGTEAQQDAFPLRCPHCGGLDLAVTAGEELCVEAVEVDVPLPSGGR